MIEKELLEYFFWNKLNNANGNYGNLIYSDKEINKDFNSVNSEILVNRDEKFINIMYSKSETKNFEEGDKEYFVKMSFEKDINGDLVLDKRKTSPEIETLEDVKLILEGLKNTIVGFKSKPDFYIVGKENNSLNKIIKLK